MPLINTYPKNSAKQLANFGLRKEFLHKSKSKAKFITNSAEPEIKLQIMNKIFN